MFKKDDKRDFRLVQNLPVGGSDFNQFMPLRYRLVIAAKHFGTVEKLSPMLLPTTSKDLFEQLKLAHKVIDVVDQASRKICVTLLRTHVDKPERSYAQVWLFARKRDDEKFQQIVYVKYKLEEYIYLLDVTNLVYDEVITNKPICNDL